MYRIRQLLEMIRFSHTIFALPFALLAAVMAWAIPALDANGHPAWIEFRPRHLLGILMCMVFARSAAMAFNRLVDRNLDAENPRTAGRHLPAGTLSARSVVSFTVISSAGFVGSTLLFRPNWLPLLLSGPLLAFLFGYSLSKRVTPLAHFWLGTALMLTPICAWIALRGEAVLRSPLDILPAFWLGVAVLLWVSGFDLIYACLDADFDRRARLHSVPARFGVGRALQLSALCHLGMLVVLMTLPVVGRLGGPALPLGLIYTIGVAAVTVLLAYQHWLVRADDLTRVNVAFFNVNAVLSIGLFVVTSVDLLI
jgi:4-hydroxybenzoate polyprenyltransferase